MGYNTEPSASHTDYAYRTAVARLRNMLAARPSLSRDHARIPAPPAPSCRGVMAPVRHTYPMATDGADVSGDDTALTTLVQELIAFLEKQGHVINQLETERSDNRKDLEHVLNTVEEVVNDNEELLQCLTDSSRIETAQSPSRLGPEAEVVKLRQNLRSAQEEVLALRSQLSTHQPRFPSCELHFTEIQSLASERNDLLEKTGQLEKTIQELKEREVQATEKVKSSLDLVDEMRREKATFLAEAESRKEEIAQMQNRLKQLISQGVYSRAEGCAEQDKFYISEMSRLKAELSREITASTQAKVDLDYEKRRSRDTRAEFEDKIRHLEDLRQNFQLKIETLESQLSQTVQKKAKAETEIVTMRLQAEKIEREGKQEVSLLVAELTLFRTQLNQRNLDLQKCDSRILELNQRSSELEKSFIHEKKLQQEKQEKSNEEVIKVTAEAVQQRYVSERRELEDVIQKQNILMEKLRAECYNLAQKLEEISTTFKNDKFVLEGENSRLSQSYNLALNKVQNLEQRVQYYSAGQDHMLNRVHFLEEEEKVHSHKIVALLTKQSTILKEKEKLEADLVFLKSQQ